MFHRFWNYIRALLGGGLDKLDDPDVLLTQAQQEMREMHTKNRERAVQAITRKNHLQAMLKDAEKHTARLRKHATRAREQGDVALAKKIEREIEEYETVLRSTRAALEQATFEAFKDKIEREDERIQEKINETLRLEDQWKLSQMPLLPVGIPERKTDKPCLTTRGLVILNLFLLALVVLLFLLTRNRA